MIALPIDPVLPDLVTALSEHGCVVLQAPPGAGKTTRVPHALLDAGLVKGKTIMLEPRRIAARAAAERLAEGLNEKPGQTVGYRMRGDHKPGQRIEVVTEGILTRMIQADPALTDVGALIFDEFHERSLNADLGLALAWELRQVLRPDLLLVVMSATLDADPVAAMLDAAPVVTSKGRTYPVTTHFLDRALPKNTRLEQATADLVTKVVSRTEGGVLVFLPGEGEIKRTAAALSHRLPGDCLIQPLYGALPFKEQRAAIAPAQTGRKIVLSTSIAETSLTISDIRVVVDAGRARRARFDPGSGMSRLVTEKVSRAEATQRAGRAGRVAPGDAFCLWTKGEHGALPAFAPAEIESADLAALALELAIWGSDELCFLTPPPPGALAEARTLLQNLGALDGNQRITAHGRALAALPLHPRLGHMLQLAGKQAAPLAALLSGRDPLRGAPVDVTLRLRALNGNYAGPGEVQHAALSQIKADIPRLTRDASAQPARSTAQQLALAYPDRIGLRRKGDAPRYVLSGGKGAVMDAGDPLAGQRLIVVSDLDGDAREARIRQATSISESELRDMFSDDIHWRDLCLWSKRDNQVLSRKQECFGALVLDDRVWADAPDDLVARAMLEGVRQLGLRLSPAAARFQARVALIDDLPRMDDDTLLDTLEDWLLPYLQNVRSASDWRRFDVLPALRAMLDWDQMQRLDTQAPAHFETPLGRRIPIDYAGDAPAITLRLQEMFGVTRHPTVGRMPLRVTLLSPGQKPVQVTQDIVGFWASSYADVRRDMRGRYPRHPWPEDPTQADPTLRAKPRGT
ncbi:ATP-dependent helicase HrpB [Yoonia sediminilitoris]|uniref:ATP-dependent helicase HrpB n=1 Tax=Yoonia sediminilitoris TaxID=1286148 RepID=A0A2T6K7N2_9RHOB|nr:ATP-dependent helicase HrpB [Yoonia sediminilitoris]PUB10729.1 ATP-dependent helicase HrpB [Yoonia sediminilitoris]RCW90481.1 ATP-dependent helicase HrpB [Yoonia sediminilitoris]